MSLTVIGVFLLSSFWFWTCLEIIAGLLVAVGCWGEWYLFKNPPDEKDESRKLQHRRRELQFIISVATGVTLEFAALSHAIPEAIQLEKGVAEIRTTNAKLVADNLVLRSTVAALELQVMETSNNVANADPRNQLLKSVTAVATLFFSSSVIFSNKAVDSMILRKGVSLLEMKLFSKNSGYMVGLNADGPLPMPFEYLGKNGLPESNSVSIHLSGEAEMRQPYAMQWNGLVLKTNLNAGQIADGDFDVSLAPSFLRPGTVVFGGSVAVWFNSKTVERDFSIPPQQISDWEFGFLKCVPTTKLDQIPQK